MEGSTGLTPTAYFEHARRAFDAVSRRHGVIEATYEIAGLPVRLRFAGGSLLRSVTRAFAHLPTSESARLPLTIGLWDGALAGMASLQPPCPLGQFTARGEIRGFNTGSIQTAYQPFGRLLSVIDLQARQAVWYAGDSAAIPYFERGSPLRPILSWWMRRNGRQLVHAGAVGTATGGVLIAGKSGAGKSTIALACLAAGFGYAADDFCALANAPAPTVYSLYCSGRLHWRDECRLPFLAGMASNPGRLDEEKALYFVDRAFPGAPIAEFPLRAILVPRPVEQQASALRPASPSTAMMALAPTTTALLPDAGAEVFHLLLPIVRSVPCFHLDLGTDITAVPSLIGGLLDRLNRVPAHGAR